MKHVVLEDESIALPEMNVLYGDIILPVVKHGASSRWLKPESLIHDI